MSDEIICKVCGLPKDVCACESIALEQQVVTVSTERRKYGKYMTLIKGLDTTAIDMDSLETKLKTVCAAGGTTKGDTIEVQGNHVNNKRLWAVLEELGIHAGKA